MLVATRDPMHHQGAHDPSLSPRDHRDGMPGAHPPAPHAARAVTMLQLAGSLLAIPVALGSAYSIYQANFSPDTQCQSLRGSIISMIDKKIDAATRRMLVRRDVEAFEKSCGSFDPDAKAAFVTLLAAQPLRVPAHAVVAPKAERPKAEAAVKVATPKVAPTKLDADKAEPRPAAVAAKHEAPAAAVTEAAAREAASSDAHWLDAVRGALVTHEAARSAAAAAEAARAPAAPPLLKPTLAPTPAEPVRESLAAAPTARAPALPAATAIAAPATPQPERAADADHPVPPGTIPTVDVANAGVGSRATWISRIPFVGQMLDK